MLHSNNRRGVFDITGGGTVRILIGMSNCSKLDSAAESELDEKAVLNFRTYLQFATVHPKPNYRPALTWLRSLGCELSLDCYVTEIVPENPILVMRWEGSSPELPAILLNSHMDVVPVDESKWTYPPFGATLSQDGKIYARGAQDIKCLGIQQLEAVRRLKARGHNQLRRTVYISFVPDEELGGKLGMAPFVAGHNPPSDKFPNEIRFSEMNIGLLMDEGLANPTNEYLAFYEERRPCWFVARFHGKTGHASALMENTAGEKLAKFLDRIMTFRKREEERLKNSNGELGLGDVVSVNLTMLSGGMQLNILPPELSATFDARLTPTYSLDAWKGQLNQWAEEIGGGVDFEFINTGVQYWEPSTCPDEKTNPWWSALIKVCQNAGVPVRKCIFPGSTDARFVREYNLLPGSPAGEKPIQAIGFCPIRNTPTLFHDHDEYISRDEFVRGCRLYADLLFELALTA
ncbi:unnamed protein product [Calicophoron daubneyi]|uniref:N-acyl-aliphatic-L-amino acid amidohydrolase n=1 Tax=Calicophoron daubneyi TaxID=300641 RepID=A0AAV2T662_CALDB